MSSSSNLTVERQIASGLVWSVSYVGAPSRKLAMVAEIDQALPGPGTIQPRRAYYSLLPGVSSIQEMYTAGTADYHSLQTSIEHRFAKGGTSSVTTLTATSSTILRAAVAVRWDPKLAPSR